MTILDDRGVALGGGGTPGGDAAELQASLQSALDAALGDGATIVRVRAEYAGERTSERDLRRTPTGAQEIAGTDAARVTMAAASDTEGSKRARIEGAKRTNCSP